MKKFTGITAIILAISIIFCCGCSSSETTAKKADIPQDNLGYSVGKTLADFSFTAYDGQSMSLYSTLAAKEMVLINIWATWCGPCGMEFPYMEEAYQQYKDKVEIFALSCESADSNEKLANYASANGMSFPVGRDSANLSSYFGVYSIPTTIVIDRYGTICYIESGAVTSTEAFVSLFEAFTGDDYVPSAVEDTTAPICDVTPSSEEELAKLLNAEGGSIVFKNVASESVWPFVIGEYEGRSVASSTNAGLDSTISAIIAQFEAEEDSALSIDFTLSSEAGTDLMCIYLDGTLVKSFSGEKGHMSYALAIEESGAHQLVISYGKDGISAGGEDCLHLEKIQLLSGSEAEAALAANPVYPVADKTSFRPLGDKAREIVFDDPNHVLLREENASIFSFWIVSDSEAELLFAPGPEVDPETMVFFTDFDNSYSATMLSPSKGGYSFHTGIDSIERSGYSYTSVYVENTAEAKIFRAAICFADEANLESFLSQIVDAEGKPMVSWRYADGSGEQTPTQANYTVRYTDQNGDPIPGVTLQVCDDSMCQIFVTDENGECSFTLSPYAYELHTLIIPEGWEGDTESVVLAPAEGGIIEINLTKK